MADRVGILAFDLAGRIAGADPVVHLSGDVRLPLHQVLAEVRPADGGIMPQEAVALIGQHKRHTGLRVAVCQFKVGIFDIQDVLLILPHAVELFAVIGLKAHGELVIAADDGLEEAGLNVQCACAGALGKQFFALFGCNR